MAEELPPLLELLLAAADELLLPGDMVTDEPLPPGDTVVLPLSPPAPVVTPVVTVIEFDPSLVVTTRHGFPLTMTVPFELVPTATPCRRGREPPSRPARARSEKSRCECASRKSSEGVKAYRVNAPNGGCAPCCAGVPP